MSRSRLNSRTLLAAMIIAFVGWGGQADARPFRVDQLPNGSRFGCASCHIDGGGGGPLTVFGREINLTARGRNGNVIWNAAFAMRDSDGDGVSNGRELGDPDGDKTIDPSIQVTNPGDPNDFVQMQQPPDGNMPAVTSFVIGGVTLAEDVKNPPVPSGMQRVEITFNSPVLRDSAGTFDIRNLDLVSFPFGLIELIFAAADLTVSEDSTTLTGTVNLPEGTTYQVLIGMEDTDPVFSEQQQYFLGTVELPDAVVSGIATLPEGFHPSSEPGGASLLDIEAYSNLLSRVGQEGFDDTDLFERAIVRISDITIAESFPEQLAFELQYVPDGSYALSLDQIVVDAQGNNVVLSAFEGLNIVTGEVDPDKEIRIVNGESVTSLQVALKDVQDLEAIEFSKVRVEGVNAENNLFFIQREGQQVRVVVIPGTPMFDFDPKPFDLTDLLAEASEGSLPGIEFFSLDALMPGDVVSILGLSVSEGVIQALMVIRHTISDVNADLDGDGDVDFQDFLIFVAAFGTSVGDAGYHAAADLDGDGMVVFRDFLIFANAFGEPVGGG